MIVTSVYCAVNTASNIVRMRCGRAFGARAMAAMIAASSSTLLMRFTSRFGPKLIEARLELLVRALTGAQLARHTQRNNALRFVRLGKHQSCREAIAPDQPRRAGNSLAFDFEIHLVRDQGRVLEFDLRPVWGEIAHDAGKCRTAVVERDDTAVIDPASG